MMAETLNVYGGVGATGYGAGTSFGNGHGCWPWGGEGAGCGAGVGYGGGHGHGYVKGYGYGDGNGFGYGNGRQNGAGTGYGYGIDSSYGGEYDSGAGNGCGEGFKDGSGTGCGFKEEPGREHRVGYGSGRRDGAGSGTSLNSFSRFVALLDPACIPEAMLVDSNAEIRRLSLARYGVDRFLASGKVIHARGDYALIERACNDFPMRALKMLCPSTNAVYISPVPPHCKTVEQALRWKYQTEDYFQNLVEEA